MIEKDTRFSSNAFYNIGKQENTRKYAERIAYFIAFYIENVSYLNALESATRTSSFIWNLNWIKSSLNWNELHPMQMRMYLCI